MTTINTKFIKTAIGNHLKGLDSPKLVSLAPGTRRKFLVELARPKQESDPIKIKVIADPLLQDLLGTKQSGLEILKKWDGSSDLDKERGDGIGSFPDEAAMGGNVDALKLYNGLGGDLSARNSVWRERSPASLAAENNKTQVLRFLKSIGINLTEQDQGGMTPLQRAQQSELLDKPARRSIGYLASRAVKV